MSSTRNQLVVKASPHTPPYKIHRYFARRPWNVFETLVSELTKPGDLVLDPFMGGGTTIYEASKLGRSAIGCDLNPLSIFIVEAMFEKGDSKELRDVSEKIVAVLDDFQGPVLESCDRCNQPGEIEWCELVHTVTCPGCGQRCELSEGQKLGPGRYVCGNRSCSMPEGFTTSRIKRLEPRYKYAVIRCTECKNTWTEDFDEPHLAGLNEQIDALKKRLNESGIEPGKNVIPKNWDRQYEDLLEAKGFTFFEDLFTERNLLELNLLKAEIETKVKDEKIRLALRFALSDSIRDVNIMSFTNSKWQSGKPTTWSKHAYWTPSEFCEVSVKEAFRNSVTSLLRSWEFNNSKNFQGVLVKEDSAQKLKPYQVKLHAGPVESTNIPENSVDAIITDPPYGSNVQYAELSHFWFPWNQDLYKTSPNFSSEAVVNRKQGFDGSKDYSHYEGNLLGVFSAGHKALKPNGVLALTFNNKDLRAWVALLVAITKSGFRYIPGSVYFQDGVSNYKQTAHTRFAGSPFGDFVYMFEKAPLEIDPQFVANSSLTDEINRALKTADGLLARGNSREGVMTGFYDQLVRVVQQLIKPDDPLASNRIYESFLGSELGVFYQRRGSTK